MSKSFMKIVPVVVFCVPKYVRKCGVAKVGEYHFGGGGVKTRSLSFQKN